MSKNTKMMKLELKHLAPYLAHKLKVMRPMKKAISSTPDTYEISELKGMYFDDFVNDWKVELSDKSTTLLENIKPSLRPFSEYCGKTIAKDVMNKLNCDSFVVHEIWDLENGDKVLDEISVRTYNILCKNHIDFNKLIPEGLAVDINTL
jgi:hypothetical protein